MITVLFDTWPSLRTRTGQCADGERESLVPWDLRGARVRLTVRQAMALLRAEGLVDVEHGRGTFVGPSPDPAGYISPLREVRSLRQESIPHGG
jgi:hypothetical protein